MNVSRAEQIVQSGKEIEVMYNGKSIWIQNVNPEEGTARVYSRENPDTEMTVRIQDLQEQ